MRPGEHETYERGKNGRRLKRKNPTSTSQSNTSSYSSPSQYEAPKEAPSQYGSDKCPANRRRYRRQSDCKNSKGPNCWSAGTYDLDCPNSGLCCFDGCVNRCVEESKGEDLPSYGEYNGDSISSYKPQSAYESPEDIPNNYLQPVEDDKAPSSSYGTSGTSTAVSNYDSPSYSDSYGSLLADDPLDPLHDPLDNQQYGPEPVKGDTYSSLQDYARPSGTESSQGYSTLGQVTGNFQFDFPIFGNSDIPDALGDVLSDTYNPPSTSSSGGGYQAATTEAPKPSTGYRPPIKNKDSYGAPPKQPTNTKYSPPTKNSNTYGAPPKQQSYGGSKPASEKVSSGPVVVLHIYGKDAASIKAYNHVGDFSKTLQERARNDKTLENEAYRINLETVGNIKRKSSREGNTSDGRRRRRLGFHTRQYANVQPNKAQLSYTLNTKNITNGLYVSAQVQPQELSRCPFIGKKSSAECRNYVSTECHNPNVNDAKCHKGGLCCFDGCTYRCIENIDTEVNRRSDERSRGSEAQVYDQNKNLGVCKKVNPFPRHMCRLRFVHECHALGRSTHECSKDKTYCCFDGCVNRCVDLHKTTLKRPAPYVYGSTSSQRADNIEENDDMFSHQSSRHPRLQTVNDDFMGDIHGALYEFFMGENIDPA